MHEPAGSIKHSQTAGRRTPLPSMRRGTGARARYGHGHKDRNLNRTTREIVTIAEAAIKPSRPIMRYHGGKWRLADWIIGHFPPVSSYGMYVEPFSGAASVLMRKPRALAEILNDRHQRLVNVFRVLRHPAAAQQLAELLKFTPYSKAEYESCREKSDDPIEDARRMIVLAYQGHGSTGPCGGKKTGWRRGIRPHGPNSAAEWGNIHTHVYAWADRLRGVFIECDDYSDVIKRWDTPKTLFYIDPPYLPETRSAEGGYEHDFSEEDHVQLARLLHKIKGYAVVSGYPSELYENLFAGWRRYERATIADRQRERVEVIWISPNTPTRQMELFT